MAGWLAGWVGGWPQPTQRPSCPFFRDGREQSGWVAGWGVDGWLAGRVCEWIDGWVGWVGLGALAGGCLAGWVGRVVGWLGSVAVWVAGWSAERVAGLCADFF